MCQICVDLVNKYYPDKTPKEQHDILFNWTAFPFLNPNTDKSRKKLERQLIEAKDYMSGKKKFILDDDVYPRYKHECDTCEFMGNYGDMDGYYCNYPEKHFVILRVGNEETEYISYDVESIKNLKYPELFSYAQISFAKQIIDKYNYIYNIQET